MRTGAPRLKRGDVAELKSRNLLDPSSEIDLVGWGITVEYWYRNCDPLSESSSSSSFVGLFDFVFDPLRFSFRALGSFRGFTDSFPAKNRTFNILGILFLYPAFTMYPGAFHVHSQSVFRPAFKVVPSVEVRGFQRVYLGVSAVLRGIDPPRDVLRNACKNMILLQTFPLLVGHWYSYHESPQ